MDGKPIFSKQVNAKIRVYYFDVQKDKKGQPYLVISEIPKDKSPGIKERKRIVVFPENLENFEDALFEVIEVLNYQNK